MSRKAIYPTDRGRRALYDKRLCSPAIRTGDVPFLSGQVRNQSDSSPAPDFAAQVRLAFGGRAASHRCEFDNVVDVTAFYTDFVHQADVVRTFERTSS